MGPDEFFELLSRYLTEKRSEPVPIGPHTNMLESGAIDSFMMVEMLLFLEETTGRTVDLDMLEPDTFEDATRLYKTFFRENAEAQGQ